ncbi:hypothetical protein F5887DRAFT_1074217 [Amanita rubescens]|nr:hypothetical protein F5887DRAFT_1074217 [Amanita rubescens]
MGKLNIAHHKSYHPYRRDNIERVRRDEEEAKLKEAQEEGRVMLADSEARLGLLRQRASVGSDLTKKQSRRQEEQEEQRLLSERTKLDVTSSSAALPTTSGHINFFPDLEQSDFVAAIAKKKVSAVSTDKGFPLAPSKKDLRPWYSSKKGESSTEDDDQRDKESAAEKRLRDTARKTGHDPLTSINHQLSSHKSSGTSSSSIQGYDRFKRPELPHRARSASNSSSSSSAAADSNNKPTSVEARLARESSERERALALIRRRKREMMGSETPSTTHGGMEGEGYGDIFNKKEVEEARKSRERGHVYWDERESGSPRKSLSSRRW